MHSSIPRPRPSLVPCCLRAPGHSSPCPALPAPPRSQPPAGQQPHSPDRPAAPRLLAASLQLSPAHPPHPPPLDDSLRSLPGGSQIPSPPLARAAIRSWRPLPGHQAEPRGAGREEESVGCDSEQGRPFLSRSDRAGTDLGQILKAMPASRAVTRGQSCPPLRAKLSPTTASGPRAPKIKT